MAHRLTDLRLLLPPPPPTHSITHVCMPAGGVDNVDVLPGLAGLPGVWRTGLGQSGEFWMLMAAQSMAVGTVMVR